MAASMKENEQRQSTNKHFQLLQMEGEVERGDLLVIQWWDTRTKEKQWKLLA